VITVTAADLARLLNGTKPFMDVTGLVPTLSAVYMRAQDGVVTATATDRHVVAQVRVAAADGTDMPAVLLAAADVYAVLRLFKPSRDNPGAEVTIDVGERAGNGQAQVRFTANGLAGTELSASFTGSAPDAFPRIGALYEAVYEREDGAYGVGPGYLAKLTKAAVAVCGNQPLRVLPTALLKPIRVECGDSFVALLMPVRLAGYYQPLPVMDVEPKPETPAEAA
jgi:hypothetical protein